MPQVRAVAVLKLRGLAARAEALADRADEAARAHFALLAEDVRRFLARSYDPGRLPRAPGLPPGA